MEQMVTDRDVEIINDAIYWRGLFIHRYSGIEFSLNELIVRARHHDVYNVLGDLPTRWDKKLARLDLLASMDGPIRYFQDEIRSSLSEFAAFEPSRHFLVHGLMAVSRSATERTTLCFCMYQRRRIDNVTKGKPVTHAGMLSLAFEELKSIAQTLQPTSTSFPALVARICDDVPLPPA